MEIIEELFLGIEGFEGFSVPTASGRRIYNSAREESAP